MTLSEFLTLTATTPALVLRRALAASLSVEKPATREAYSRFYRRVIGTLGVPSSRQRVGWPTPKLLGSNSWWIRAAGRQAEQPTLP